MIYKDHSDLADAYDKVLVKETMLAGGISSNEPAPEAMPEIKIDPFKKALGQLDGLLKGKVDFPTMQQIHEILKAVASDSFQKGQASGKENWKN